jgi:ubiquinone/menaquinone biosynthesis C-methylase UbiE
MGNDHEHERRSQGGADRLRSAERVALLEIPRVAELSREGLKVLETLDVGSGSGLFAEAFAALGSAVTGVDVNAQLLATARGFVPSGTFLEATAESLPFPDGSFDLVFLGLVLHETDDPLTALREARRVTRHRVCVLEWPYDEGPHGPPLAHRLKEEAFAVLALQAGFSKLETIRLRHLVFYRLDA